MKKISSALLAAALIVGIAAFAPVPAQAIDWCLECDNDPYFCWACCKCGGGTNRECAVECGSPDSATETEATLTSEDEGEILVCTEDMPVDDDEAPITDEPTPEASQ